MKQWGGPHVRTPACKLGTAPVNGLARIMRSAHNGSSEYEPCATSEDKRT